MAWVNLNIGKPISRLIRKFITLHFAIEELARFTRSTRYYRILKKGNFKVVCLNAAAYPFPVPGSKVEWTSVFESALQSSSAGYERNKEYGHFIRQVIESHQNKTGKRQYPVHCECLLLQHFSTEGFISPNPRPVSYIGISKLSCPACAAVFNAWNQISNNQFQYHGSHGKWYPPWAVPRAWGKQIKNQPSLFNAIYDEVARLFISTLERKEIIRRHWSDSSAGSTPSVTEGEVHAYLQVDFKLMKAERQKERNGEGGS